MEAADQTRARGLSLPPLPRALFGYFWQSSLYGQFGVSSHLHDLSPWIHESITEGRTHVAKPKHAETTTKHNTADSEQSNAQAQIQDTAPDHSNAIRHRVPMNFGGKSREQDELITCRLVGLLVGFPFQPSSVCEECYDSKHDDENDYEDKHHPAVPSPVRQWTHRALFDIQQPLIPRCTRTTSNVMTKEILSQSNDRKEYIDGAGKDTYCYTNETNWDDNVIQTCKLRRKAQQVLQQTAVVLSREY
ncbi:hypothetical protein N7519_006149 [Penicillium mononematosum]|uniref:uncharacterized protein n=1 Tax=Penicillium mononematosum TaxID=268346 RepID=UPI002548B533|nr:uncharacterized protein N7519_006149 [Penicillium mononematosum]KAJ6184848.1 hypothetical protein N7519_006149 [Penicillium mononematosum]